MDVVLKQQILSISCSLRYYNIFPYVSEISSAVLDGDIDRMKHFLSVGEVTPYGVREDGPSLLGLAAFRCYPDICRILIHQGAGIDRVSPHGESVLESVAIGLLCGSRGEGFQNFKENTTASIDLVMSLTTHDEAEKPEYEPDYATPYFRKLVQSAGTSNASRLSIEERAQIIVNCRSPDIVEELLGPDLSLRQAFARTSTEQPRYRRLLTAILATPKDERYRWTQICRELIAFDRSLDLDRFERSRLTFIESLIDMCSWDTKLTYIDTDTCIWNIPLRSIAICRDGWPI